MAAKASGVLTLDTAPFIKSLEAAKVALKGFATAVAAIALTAVAGFAVLGVGIFKIVSAFKTGVVAAYEFGKEMNSAVRQIQGVSVGNFFILQKALEKSGMSAEEARSSIKSMEETGMNWSSLWKTPADAATAIAAAKKDFGPMSEALDKGAKAISALRNIIDSLNMKFATFFQSFLAGIVGPLRYLLQQINDAIDLSGVGTKLGEKLGTVLDQWIGGIANSNIGEVLGAQLKLAWIALVEAISEFFKAAGEGLDFAGKLATVFSTAGSLLVSLLIGAFKEGAYLFRDILSQSWLLFSKILNEIAPVFFRKSDPLAQAIEEKRRTGRELNKLQVQSRREENLTGDNKLIFEAKIAEARVKLVRDQAIINYESGQAAINTPLQAGYVKDYLTQRGADTEFKDQLRRAETAKDITEKSAALMDAGKAVGGLVGEVAKQAGQFGLTVAGPKFEAQEALDYAAYTATLKREKDAKNNAVISAAPYLAGKPFEALTTSLGKIGGGGGSFLTSQTAQEQRQIQALKNGLNMEKTLNVIAGNTDPENPKAGAKGPVMLP